MTNIKDYPELIEPADADWLLIQEDNTIPAYKKTRLAAIRNSASICSCLSVGWTYRDGSVDFAASAGKYLIDTPVNVTIDLDNVTEGSEVEILRLSSNNSLFLNGIARIKGTDIDENTIVSVPFSDFPSRLIYVNTAIGWLSIPESNIEIVSPLALPNTGLIQLFNPTNIQASNEDKIALWIDEVSNNNATQSTNSARPVFKKNIFGVKSGLFFEGSQELLADLSYLANQKYTIAVVEARTSSSQNYFIGNNSSSTNKALHVGYRSNNQFTLAQFSNDIDAAIDGYDNTIKPKIWVVSNNSRGKEIYENGILIASNENTDDLIESNNGRIGSAVGNKYRGYLGLIATWIGDKTTSEIDEINTKINSSFGVY
ncbi:MAG: hypothetical protein WBF90_13285 [Rivularia sp. (in: cyanobacteria)]